MTNDDFTEPTTPDPKDTIAAFRRLLRNFGEQTPEVQSLIDEVIRAGGLSRMYRNLGSLSLDSYKPQRLKYIGDPANPGSGIFPSPDLPFIFDREPDGNSVESDWLNRQSGPADSYNFGVDEGGIPQLPLSELFLKIGDGSHDSYPGSKDPSPGQADASAATDKPSDTEGEAESEPS